MLFNEMTKSLQRSETGNASGEMVASRRQGRKNISKQPQKVTGTVAEQEHVIRGGHSDRHSPR